MRPSHLTNLINLLTLERARFYALVTMLLLCSAELAGFYSNPERLITRTDFPAFYNAGRILNEGGPLYDPQLQEHLYKEMESGVTAERRSTRFFAYAPFFALIFKPLARLPYLWALICWVLISVALFFSGFLLGWKAALLPSNVRISAFMIALSFVPFYAWNLFLAQTAAFGFFVLASAIYLERRGHLVAGGVCLALMIYKPPLLILLLPMLLITKRRSMLMGFFIGTILLLLVSLWTLGLSGASAYARMLYSFSVLKATGARQTLLEVDAYSFFFSLVGGHAWLAAILFLILAGSITPFLLAAWHRNPENSWSHAITWTIVLNFYVLLYDSSLIILAVVLSAKPLMRSARNQLPSGFRWLLLALFAVPWLERNSVAAFGFQPVTVVLTAFGFYQLWTTLEQHTSWTLAQSTPERTHL